MKKIRDFLFKNYLGDGEKISFVIHRHLFMQLGDFAKITFFGLIVPLFVMWLFPKTIVITGVWFLVGVVRFIYEFFDWYYDAWLVTDVSIIAITWQGFFEKSSARIEYHIIQGIGYEVKGIVRTIFNYGDITLEKFTGNASVFNGAVRPKKKVEQLGAAQEQFVKHKNFRDHHALQSLLTDLMHQHVVEYGIDKDAIRN